MPHFYISKTYLNEIVLGNVFFSFILIYEEKLLSNKETEMNYIPKSYKASKPARLLPWLERGPGSLLLCCFISV